MKKEFKKSVVGKTKTKELTKKEENRCYKLAQKIDNYYEKIDGCYWGHILDIVEKVYKEGKNSL